jgi:hypothetical protein
VKFRESAFPARTPTPPPTVVHHDDLLWHDIDDDITTNTTPDNDDDDDDDDDDETPQLDDSEDDNDDDYGSGPAGSGDEGDDGVAGATPRRTRSGNPDVATADWRDIYNAHDAGKRNKTIADVATGDDKWAPKRFSSISQIENVKQRDDWYKAHYSENDGLLDSETALHPAAGLHHQQGHYVPQHALLGQGRWPPKGPHGAQLEGGGQRPASLPGHILTDRAPDHLPHALRPRRPVRVDHPRVRPQASLPAGHLARAHQEGDRPRT